MERCRVFAPASIANLGPGFDVLGVAVSGLGDTLTATRSRTPGVRLIAVRGDETLPLDATRNTAGIAAQHVLTALGVSDGMRIELDKGVPGGSGLGSSATSAAAGAFAAVTLFSGTLSPTDLLRAATQAEEAVSGAFFADNTAPSLLGGAQLIASYEPFETVSLGIIPDVHLVLVTPRLRVLTRDARDLLPPAVSMTTHIEHTGRAAAIVAALGNQDYALFARSIRDDIVEPVRATLIPGYEEARRAAFDAGADAFTIAGSGPTVLAVTDRATKAERVGAAISEAFANVQVAATARVATMEARGARRLD